MPKSEVVSEKGPWPFVTWRVVRSADDRRQVYSSRQHRKGLLLRAAAPAETIWLARKLLRCVWSPRQLNWWIGTVFALGSLLFALASVLSLAPSLAQTWSLDSTRVNAIFFVGSIPFTIAAYLQLFQAANAGAFEPEGRKSSERPKLFGWQPQNIGWLSSTLQFIGTILFNFNTFDAMTPSLDWLQQDLDIWAPDFVGSILFLAAGYLAFIETCHAHWAWKPKHISWWVVFTNLLGCVAFMISAVLAIVLPGSTSTAMVTLSIVFTLLGAISFFVGSALMLPEMVVEHEP